MAIQEKVERIFLHCTASGPGTTYEDVRRWHVEERGWDDVGYHYLILADGELVSCRPEHIVPAAQKGHNKNTVAIALVGEGFYSVPQIAVAKGLVARLIKKHDLSCRDIWVHNEVSDKECPMFSSKDFIYIIQDPFK